MIIHEYQAKEIFKKYGIAVLKGIVAKDRAEAKRHIEELFPHQAVIKAQVHAGGRGKAGGVKVAHNQQVALQVANDMFGKRIITEQTGSHGKEIHQIYIEEVAQIEQPFYLSIVFDRAKECPILIACSEGGVEIEEVALQQPEKVIKVAIDPMVGFKPFYARQVGFALGFDGSMIPNFTALLQKLYNIYHRLDAIMIEINPLIIQEGDFVALDAKIEFDDNALHHHPDIVALRDLTEELPIEVEAKAHGLNYVKLEGNVGCMVNGAGLAMATMDIIKHEGAKPANFLDVGGGASSETIAKGFEIILADKAVKAIFVNIFGGIVRCDRVATGIIKALEINPINVPLVVRFNGTNAKEALALLQQSGINTIMTADSLQEGASKAVACVQQA